MTSVTTTSPALIELAGSSAPACRACSAKARATFPSRNGPGGRGNLRMKSGHVSRYDLPHRGCAPAKSDARGRFALSRAHGAAAAIMIRQRSLTLDLGSFIVRRIARDQWKGGVTRAAAPRCPGARQAATPRTGDVQLDQLDSRALARPHDIVSPQLSRLRCRGSRCALHERQGSRDVRRLQRPGRLTGRPAALDGYPDHGRVGPRQ